MNRINRIVSIVFAIVFTLSLAACSPQTSEDVAVSSHSQDTVESSLRITDYTSELVVGETTVFHVETEGDANENRSSLSWNSSDESIVTVDLSGIATAVSPGQASITISVTSSSGEVYEDTVTISVSAPPYVYPVTNTYTAVYSDPNGYQIEVTLNIGPWVQGSESQNLEWAWKTVGGTGAMPLTTGDYPRGAGMSTKFTSSQAAYTFGNLSIKNAAPEFPMSNYGNGYCALDLLTSGYSVTSGYSIRMVHSTQYGSKVTSAYLDNPSIHFVSPDLSSDSWGTVPFVIGADNVFTPNTPDGDPELADFSYRLIVNGASSNDIVFQIEKGW